MGYILIVVFTLLNLGESIAVRTYAKRHGSGGMLMNAIVALFAALFFLKMEASALLRRAERLELTAHPDGQAIRFDLAFDLKQPCRACAAKKR